MGKAEELLSNVVKKVEQVSKKLGLISDVYVENKKGEYSLVNQEIMEEIQNVISELKTTIEGLSSSVKTTERETIGQINEYLDKILVDAQNNNLDINNIKIILAGAMKSIEEETTQISIETPTSKGRGGDMGVVSIKENGKSDDEKNIGGVIVSKKDEELKENIGGDYAKVSSVLDKIKIALQQVSSLSQAKDIKSANGIKDAVNGIIEGNMEELAKNCEKSAEELPDVSNVKNVKKTKSFAGLYRVVSAGLALSLLLSGIGKKDDFKIAIENDNNYAIVQIMDDIELQQEDILDSIENIYTAKESAMSEAQDVGNSEVLEEYGTSYSQDGPEVVARNEKLTHVQQLENYKESIENIKSQFKAIENPTNKDWIEFQIELNSVYGEMQEFNIHVEDKTNEYLELWNELNEQHIGQHSMSQNATEAHNTEIEINNNSIERNKEQINDIQDRSDETQAKIEFYNMLKQLPNIEEVKNIENVSETLSDFLNSDIATEIGKDRIVEFLETTDLNLFSAYTKSGVDNKEQFFEVYKLMENTYKEYVEEYCDGDNKQVQEDHYAQYFTKALGYMDKIGEKGPIDTLKAMLEQNNINNNFYEEYGHANVTEQKETGKWSSIKRSIKTIFDGQRKGEYKETVNQIKEMQTVEKDKTIEGNDR